MFKNAVCRKSMHNHNEQHWSRPTSTC